MHIQIHRPAENMEAVNMSKVTFQAYIFQLFFGAGLACLMPFLSLYMRYLGLTASQVGIVLAAKAACNMIWAPCWTRCSTRFHKKRFVLMFSLVVLLGSYLLVTLIPPVNQERSNLRFCPKKYGNFTLEQLQNITNSLENGVQPGDVRAEPGQITSDEKSTEATTTTTIATTIITTKLPTEPPDFEYQSTTETETTESERSTESFSIFDQLDKDSRDFLIREGLTPEMLKGISAQELSDLLSEAMQEIDEKEGTDEKEEATEHRKRNKGHFHSRTKRDASPEETNGVKNNTADVTTNATQSSNSSKSFLQGNIYDSIAGIMNRINKLPAQIYVVINEKVFAAILCLVMIGEMFSAPAEKLADDIWFEFLDSTDVLEKYGSHKMWFCLGFALMPPVITAIIDNTPCMLPQLSHYDIQHILIHFYSFAALIGITTLLSFCYPIYAAADGKKVLQRRSRFCRGLQLLFSDVHASLYTISTLVMGLLQGVLYTFLFWHVQDKGGSELIMGLSITAAIGGEFLMIPIQRWVVMKMGYPAAITMGLFLYGARFVFYSFLWSPWLVLIGEGFHCFSSTLMWAAVRNYPDFRLNPLVMDRSANSMLNAIYQGFGVAPGCILAGYIYEWVGADILFQGASIVATVWCILFAIIHKCKKRATKVRYAKLLQEEEENLSDGSMEYDDDWLEVAMKHQR